MGVCWGRGKAGGGLPQCWVATESESASSLFNCFEVLKCLLCHKINRKCQSLSVQYRGKNSSNAKFSKKMHRLCKMLAMEEKHGLKKL